MTQSDFIADDSALHTQLARFQVHMPKELAATAAISPRVAQLAFSFPVCKKLKLEKRQAFILCYRSLAAR
jgi:hypothetical protein